jgi:hypothetical protein
MAKRGVRGYNARDLRKHVDEFGNISVDVEIGREGVADGPRCTGANSDPSSVASFLHALADDVMAAGTQQENEA